MESEEINIYNTIWWRWGSYSEFLSDIGEDSNYNRYGCKVYFTNKGTKCFSRYEYTITEWMENKNISFNKEVLYKNIIENDQTNRKFDWVINHNNILYCVEMFGINNSDYKIKSKQKIQDCIDNNINLISIFPSDMKKPLEEIFNFINDKVGEMVG